MKRLLRYVAIALVVAIVGGCVYLNRLLPIVTGYAAKNLASAVFVSGREAKDVEALDLNFSLIRYTSNTVDYENKTVTSRFLWGKSTAVYREGCGVTLLCGATADELRGQRFPMDVLSEGQGVQDSTARAQLPVGDSAVAERLAPIAKAFVVERAYKGHPFAFVVVHKGGVVAECYDKGIGRDTKLLSWSMAKSFVNALIGIMVKDSLLDIHAPVDIPEWQGDGRKAITLNDLMQMQSGLEWNEDYGARSDVNIMLHCEGDMGLYALMKPLDYAPRTHWQYSSGTTDIVMRYLRGRFSSDEAFLRYMHSRLFCTVGHCQSRLRAGHERHACGLVVPLCHSPGFRPLRTAVPQRRLRWQRADTTGRGGGLYAQAGSCQRGPLRLFLLAEPLWQIPRCAEGHVLL